MRFAEADASNAGVLASAMAVPEAEVGARLARGVRAHVAWHGDRLACYGWVSFGREHVGELARDLVLPPGEAYVWDCATVPGFRGRGLYTALLRRIASALAAEGRRRVWIGASTTNVASNRTFTSVGFVPAASAVSLRVAGRGLLIRLRAAPGATPTLATAARSILTNR